MRMQLSKLLSRKSPSIIIKVVLMLLVSLTSIHADGKIHSGTIIEMLESNGYSYWRIEEGQDIYWVAVRLMPAYVGAHVSFKGQAWMTNFSSRTLSMTFPNILFAGYAVLGQESIDANLTVLPTINDISESEITPIVELHEQTNELAHKTVLVYGTVTKVTNNVMGKTWIHVQDESSSQDSSTIVITTLNDSAKMGTQVYARGVLSVDKDFGYGYFYPVIIEDAKINESISEQNE